LGDQENLVWGWLKALTSQILRKEVHHLVDFNYSSFFNIYKNCDCLSAGVRVNAIYPDIKEKGKKIRGM